MLELQKEEDRMDAEGDVEGEVGLEGDMGDVGMSSESQWIVNMVTVWDKDARHKQTNKQTNKQTHKQTQKRVIALSSFCFSFSFYLF